MAEDIGCTQLFIVKKFVPCDDDECHCWAIIRDETCRCELPEDPRGILTEIYVSVMQKPIVTKPIDTAFFIEIKTYSTTYNEYEKTLLSEMSFSIAPTVKDVDLDRVHNTHIKTHLSDVSGKETILHDKFKGVSSKQSYIAAFHLLINRLLTKVPDREQSENPHIGRKKKLR